MEQLKSSVPSVGVPDIMIAAHALSLHATIVTNNNRHFQRVPDLKPEN